MTTSRKDPQKKALAEMAKTLERLRAKRRTLRKQLRILDKEIKLMKHAVRTAQELPGEDYAGIALQEESLRMLKAGGWTP